MQAWTPALPVSGFIHSVVGVVAFYADVDVHGPSVLAGMTWERRRPSPACSTKPQAERLRSFCNMRITLVRFPARYAGFRPLSFWNMQAKTPAVPVP